MVSASDFDPSGVPRLGSRTAVLKSLVLAQAAMWKCQLSWSTFDWQLNVRIFSGQIREIVGLADKVVRKVCTHSRDLYRILPPSCHTASRFVLA